MTDSIESIQIKLYQLKELDVDLRIFGSDGHKYKFNAPLSREQIGEFEEMHKVKLPEDYVLFLTQIGNGGAGPFHGLQALEESRVNFYSLDSLPYTYFDLSKPFPHTKSWNVEAELEVLYEKIDEANESGNTALEESLFEQKWELIGAAEHDYGRLHICDYGCGIKISLIVNGAEKGNIWTDDRTNDGGIYPTTELGITEKISFLNWYEHWLDISLSEIQNND